MTSPPTIAVVGGGIAGLAAALELGRQGALVVVLDSSDRVGGKLRSSQVGGVDVDEGADAMLARVPYGADLARAAGLADELVHPAAGAAFLWTRGTLRAMPKATLLGIPGDLHALRESKVLSTRGSLRVPMDRWLPGDVHPEDLSVGALVTKRLGREVVERLVDPLLGGIYAGHADDLSLHATVPALAGPVADHRSLLLAVREVQSAPAGDGPVFYGLAGGMGTLPGAVLSASGATVRLSTTVRGLARTPTGWALETGSAAEPGQTLVDGVVLAVPAAPAARLLHDVSPMAAAEVASIDYASVAIVTLVLDGPSPGQGSGYLVPAVDGRTTKAVTFTSRKWGRSGPTVIRASVGRHGEERDLQRTDDELVAIVHRELTEAVGPVGTVRGSRVTRWGGGLPQYAVGHLDRVRRIRAGLDALPGLAVAGAAYDGVGVPACAKSGREAARHVLTAQWST